MKMIYLGHSAFRLEIAQSVVLIDPFLNGNSVFETTQISFEKAIEGATHILLTHGHEDHVGDTVNIAKQTGATVVGMVELIKLLEAAGVEHTSQHNLGGAFVTKDFKCTFVRADHSSSWQGQYAGVAAGLMIEAKNMQTIYHMGDTDIFSDMRLVAERFKPEIGLVPIGGHFTMDAETAALACNAYFNFKTSIPIHYQTFGVLAQTADTFTQAVKGAKVLPIGEKWEI